MYRMTPADQRLQTNRCTGLKANFWLINQIEPAFAAQRGSELMHQRIVAAVLHFSRRAVCHRRQITPDSLMQRADRTAQNLTAGKAVGGEICLTGMRGQRDRKAFSQISTYSFHSPGNPLCAQAAAGAGEQRKTSGCYRIKQFAQRRAQTQRQQRGDIFQQAFHWSDSH